MGVGNLSMRRVCKGRSGCPGAFLQVYVAKEEEGDLARQHIRVDLVVVKPRYVPSG